MRLEDVVGKGKGLVATRAIARGELILKERPVLRRPDIAVAGAREIEELNREFTRLPPEQQAAIMELADNSKLGLLAGKSLIGIFVTNCLGLGSDATENGLFLTISRFNHSCRSNAIFSWSDSNQIESVYAVQDIPVGTEITVSYIRDQFMTVQERQQYLHRVYSFDCTCDLCTLDEAGRRASDRNRLRMKSLHDEIYRTIAAGRGRKGVKLVTDLVSLMDTEMIDPATIAAVQYDAVQGCLSAGDLEEASEWAWKAYENYAIAVGPDSDEALRMKGYAENPKSHYLAGGSGGVGCPTQ